MTKGRMREIRAAAKKCGEGWMPAMEQMVIECLDTIEALQSLTRRGAEPEELPPAAKVKATDPNIKLFIDGWYDAYIIFHREKYLVQGGKDASAAKALVSKFTVAELMKTAKEAWKYPDRFNCKQAVTISGFASRYNDIKAELKLCANGGRPARTEPPGVTL